MSRQSKFLKHVRRNGAAAVITTITGTVCPHIAAVGVTYSKEWHRNNPATADCNGTGLIARTSTTKNIKAFFIPSAMIGSSNVPDNMKKEIGEKVNYDYLMIGVLDADSDVYLDITGYVVNKTYVTFDSSKFRIRNTYPLGITSEIGQASLLVKDDQL